MFSLAKDAARATFRIAKEVGGPKAMQLPTLAFMNHGAEEIPLHRIIGLTITRAVAEDADGHILGAMRMVQSEIDAKAVVAPVDVAGNAMCVGEIICKSFGKQRRRAGREDPHPALSRRSGRGFIYLFLIRRRELLCVIEVRKQQIPAAGGLALGNWRKIRVNLRRDGSDQVHFLAGASDQDIEAPPAAGGAEGAESFIKPAGFVGAVGGADDDV